ncbi:MAG: dTDP-4-dehydrorhamnose 3,5-epimerase [Acidimicrobiales bacterium]
MTRATVDGIEGVTLQPFTPHRDERGSLTEIWRANTQEGSAPRQWNVVRSEQGVLRGVHVHQRHHDLLLLAEGAAVIGLHDLRAASPSFRRAATVELRAGSGAIAIPPGVAHGFCFTEPSIHVYAVSHYFDPADEHGCRFDDPELRLDWPVTEPLISERDAALPSLAELMSTLPPQVPAAEPLV